MSQDVNLSLLPWISQEDDPLDLYLNLAFHLLNGYNTTDRIYSFGTLLPKVGSKNKLLY